MARLNEEQKVFVVQALACFMGPTEIVKLVKETFKVSITPQNVMHYNPTVGLPAPKKWEKLFWEYREKYLTEVDDIPIANKAYRLNQLQEIHDKAKKDNEPDVSTNVLEQAAKEMGEAYTNKKQISGPNEGPIVIKPDLSNLSDAELKITRNMARKTKAG